MAKAIILLAFFALASSHSAHASLREQLTRIDWRRAFCITARTQINAFLEKNGFKTLDQDPHAINAKRSSYDGFFRQPPLHIATVSGDTDLVHLLLTFGADVNAKTAQGSTPLHHAACHDYCDTAKLLLAYGADINTRDNWGHTPLHNAAIYNENTDIAVLLIARGADVNARDNDGCTPLHNADADIVLPLVKNGADVNARDNNGNTPLHNTIDRNHIGTDHVVSQLIASGADVNARNNHGWTPLWYAFSNGSTAELLRRHGATR